MAHRDDVLDDEEPLDLGPEPRSPRERLIAPFRRIRAARGRWRRLGLVLLIIVLPLIVLYYLIGMVWLHDIDDDPAFQPPDPVADGSRAVNTAAALIEREVEDNGWRANDPFFLPGAMLDNMPNYQQGIVYALSRFVVEMSDQIGRARGSSQVDRDLDRAAGLLRYPGDRWVIDFSTSWAPVAPAESQYRAAAAALRAYNGRLAEGAAVFDRRADNLLNTINRIAADLGSSSALIAEHLEEQGGWLIDTTADDIFYATKGRLYGYYMILDALGRDFADVIAANGLETVWAQMLDSLREAAVLQPWIVISGGPDSQLLPSHLAAQGFYLLRARTQLREVSNVLAN